MRTRGAKRFLNFVLLLIGAFAVYVAWSWPWAKDVVQNNESFFKLIGLGFGPVLALIGFFYGLVDKAEIKDITEELGKAKQAAEDEHSDAERARLEVQRS